MPIKYVHKSLVRINEKTSTLFDDLISILVNARIYFNFDFDFYLFYITKQYQGLIQAAFDIGMPILGTLYWVCPN